MATSPVKACLTCQKGGINVLDCKLHKLCQECFQKNALKFGVHAMCTCPATECQGTGVAVALPQPLFIYVDNSNIWIAAQNHPSIVKRFHKSQHDHRVRIDFGKLVDIVAKKRPVGHVTLYGSVPPPQDSVWNKARELGWNVVTKKRSFCTGKEKKVDVQFAVDAVEEAGSEPSTIVFVTGDTDMYPAAEKIVKKGRKVEIYMWSHALSGDWRELSKANKDVIYETLDAYLSDIVFIVRLFPSGKRCIVEDLLFSLSSQVHFPNTILMISGGIISNALPNGRFSIRG